MEYEKVAADENSIHKKFLSNPMYNSLYCYFNYKAPGGRLGRVKYTKEHSIVICQMKYGKARLYFDVHLDENGAVNTMVFDFRNIFDKFIAKKSVEKHGSDYEEFVYKVLYKTKFSLRNVCLFRNYEGGIVGDNEKYPAFGISLVDYTNDKFNLFTPWAGVLNEVLDALDAVNGFVGDNKKNKLTRKDIDEGAVKSPLMGIMLIVAGYLAIVGGLALIIINKSWIPFFKWVVGIILILAGLFFGPCIHLVTRTEKKEYYSNSGDSLKNFHKADKKMFITIED
ncbi:MAG: DUF308 domain-containing protein [Erysipelotrichales bacterium]|nr:DUF308 domain-containing protein [Erysipelotrichales bacterium]